MQVYNDLSRSYQELEPQQDHHFKIYVCGPTVYDFFHLGNARPFIVYDTLRRYLEYLDYKVTYVQNFTDIDDKMIKRANSEGITVQELADRMISEYFTDADGLNIKRATHHPRATECIADILAMIETLQAKGYAYVADDGVYFETDKFAEYGKLAHRDLEEQQEGASQRVELNDSKRGPRDFVLWKFAKPGEPEWDSPWGKGRPGWHIECSAMNKKYLGDTVDIHGGGQDLVFPHHENEIAQSEAANGKPFVRYWLHNGFINVDYAKMAKSAGNFFTVRDLVEKYPYMVLRFFMLQTHYRMPINFSDALLDAAASGLERIENCVENVEFILRHKCKEVSHLNDGQLAEDIREAETNFRHAMDSDLNTPDAFAAIFELVRKVNSAAVAEDMPVEELRAAKEKIVELCGVLGVDVSSSGTKIPAEVTDLVEQRALAKKERNFALADQLRDRIAELGYKVEDTPQGAKLTQLN